MKIKISPSFIIIALLSFLVIRFTDHYLKKHEQTGEKINEEIQRLTASLGRDDSTTHPVKGLDVSHINGKIDWKQVAKADYSFAFIKATGGQYFIDPNFEENRKQAKEAGLSYGPYHFFYTKDSASDQAAHFIEKVGELGYRDLAPVLDLESKGLDSNISDSLLTHKILEWLELVENGLGKKPLIYTHISFANRYLTDPEFGNYPLWIADWRVKKPKLPDTWSKKGWEFWQYSEKGKVAGIKTHVDMSVFKGSQLGFWAFIGREDI